MLYVSVITPVYNAEPTVRRAVESAVDLPEVGEILLIDDAGPDNAFEICQELERMHPKVRLLRHPDHGNHGAGASRNLGIAEANFPLVAFLDADDYYLPHRFVRDLEILENDPSIDGVYGATGIDYEDEIARERFHAAGYEWAELTTLNGTVTPSELFAVLMNQHPTVKGQFSTDAITLRSEIFSRCGVFNTQLRQRQDIQFWARLAAAASLMAGMIEKPVAIRGVHPRNRILNRRDSERYIKPFWKYLRKDLEALDVGREKWRVFERVESNFLFRHGALGEFLIAVTRELYVEPQRILKPYGAFDLAILDRFNSSPAACRALSIKNRIFSSGRDSSKA